MKKHLKTVVEFERSRPTAADVIDRVIDKGIVIEYRAAVSVGGIDVLVTVDARYVVASLDTHLEYAEPLRNTGRPGRGRVGR